MNYCLGYAASAYEENIYDSIDYAGENGFEAVELNANMPIFFPERFSAEERKKIKEYKESKNVRVTLHGPEDITLLQLQKSIRDASLARIKEVIDFGSDIGAECLTIHIGPAVCFTLIDRKAFLDELFKDEYKEVLVNSLKELADYAKEKMTLCVENSGRFPEVFVQEVLDELLYSENLFLTWDIGHSYENKYNEVQFFERNIDKIKVSHVHDHNGKSDHQILGEGNVDFKRHFDLMANKDIIFILEVRPRVNATKSLAKLKDILK
jgi:sugar phosphate isomerase/epimerase